ncbi:MAG: hypothetical protein KJZ53_04390 [Anaerolineales bacterium]|nr:hypothetical protein [Anaerolineales bacterium]
MKDNWSYQKLIKARCLHAIMLLLITLAAICLVAKAVKTGSIETSDFISLAALAISLIPLILQVLHQPVLRLETESVAPYSKSRDKTPSSWFHRLHVINDGLVAAQNCVVKLIDIRSEDGKRIEKFDPVLFYWSHQNENTDFKPVSIFGRGDYAILDIYQEKVVKEVPPRDQFNPYFEGRSVHLEGSLKELLEKVGSLRLYMPPPEVWPYASEDRYSPGDKPILFPGTYYLKIGIYSDNGYAKPTWYQLEIASHPIDEANPSERPVTKSRILKRTSQSKTTVN